MGFAFFVLAMLGNTIVDKDQTIIALDFRSNSGGYTKIYDSDGQRLDAPATKAQYDWHRLNGSRWLLLILGAGGFAAGIAIDSRRNKAIKQSVDFA